MRPTPHSLLRTILDLLESAEDRALWVQHPDRPPHVEQLHVIVTDRATVAALLHRLDLELREPGPAVNDGKDYDGVGVPWGGE